MQKHILHSIRVRHLGALLALIAIVGCDHHKSSTAAPSYWLQFADQDTCEALEKETTLVGNAMTVDELEKESIPGTESSTGKPYYPYNDSYTDWATLKRYILPGDKLYRYQNISSRGIILMRNNCVIVRLMETVIN